MRRAGVALLIALAAAGCHRAPAEVAEVRPDWSRFVMDGIAPLMTPDQVRRALAAHGYRRSDCGVDEPIDPHALDRGNDLPCFDDPARGWRVSLYFTDLVEGRRLTVASFSDLNAFKATDAVNAARNAAFRRKLIARFGPPDLTHPSGEVTIRLWKVPGGSASLPDNLMTHQVPFEGRNVEMTSFWAYGHQKPTPEPRAKR